MKRKMKKMNVQLKGDLRDKSGLRRLLSGEEYLLPKKEDLNSDPHQQCTLSMATWGYNTALWEHRQLYHCNSLPNSLAPGLVTNSQANKAE